MTSCPCGRTDTDIFPPHFVVAWLCKPYAAGTAIASAASDTPATHLIVGNVTCLARAIKPTEPPTSNPAAVAVRAAIKLIVRMMLLLT